MTSMTLAGDFPVAALGLICSLGCALVLAFVALRFVIGLVTREQYNVTDDTRRVRAIVWMGDRGNRTSTESRGSRGSTRGPYLLAAAAPPNRFARIAKPVTPDIRRFVRLRQGSGGGTTQIGPADDGHAS
jgi:hypothetical protein